MYFSFASLMETPKQLQLKYSNKPEYIPERSSMENVIVISEMLVTLKTAENRVLHRQLQ